MSDVAAQMLSILVSAIGLVVFRLIAKYLPEDPEPVRPSRKPAQNDDSEDDDAQV